MGRGGKKYPEQNVFNWEEIKSHDSQNDRWIVIGGQVYDVTNWSKRHPGGSRMLGLYGGQDATEAFNAFHNDLPAVKKYLSPIQIGTVDQYEDTEIKQDLRKLKEVAVKMGLFEASYTFYMITLLCIILLDIAAYLVMYYFGAGWIPFLVSLACISTCQAQVAWNMHDYGHLSVFRNSKIDHFFHHFTKGFLKGGSASWWNQNHYRHHAKPNVIDKDPDVKFDKLFVVGDTMPVEVAKARKKSVPFNLQHKYFFALGPPLLFPLYFQFLVFRYIINKKHWMELSIASIFYIKFVYLYLPMLGFGWMLVFFFAMRSIESHWFVWVAYSNHIPMAVKHDDPNSPWLKLQMHATCDVEKSFFNDWFTGHLNFQIEHHLFPTMPRHNLYKIAPYVKSVCEKHNIPYIVKPLWQSFKDIYSTFKASGELWKMTYLEFHT